MEKEEINESKPNLPYNEINAKTSASSCWMMSILQTPVGAGPVSAQTQNKLHTNNQNKLHVNKQNYDENVGTRCHATQNAITLISLVITIIILLILAGVTINLTLGENGIFGLAQKAGKNYMDAQNRELSDLDNIYSYIDNARLPENTKDTEAGTVVKMPDNWYSEISAFYEAPEGKEVKKAQKIASVYGVSDGLGNTIPIPKEFYYVGGDIKTGIVISDSEKDRNKYAGKNQDGTAKEVEKDLVGNQFVWIPCEEKDYHKINWGLDNGRWELETGDIETTQIQKYGGFYIGRYEAGVSTLDSASGTFKNSVTFNNGATLNGNVTGETGYNSWSWQNYSYTARSSAVSAMLGAEKGQNKANGNIVVKGDSIPYYFADYYTAVEMSSRLYKNKTSVKSTLVTGTMWDMMMKYMQDNDIAIKGAECNWGNYDDVALDELTGYYTGINTSNGSTDTDGFKPCSGLTNQSTNGGESSYILLTTGASKKAKKMNIYDVSGNLWEWTEEAAYINISYSNSDYNTHMIRGGSLGNAHASYPACYRNAKYALNASTGIGFRPALYIK